MGSFDRDWGNKHHMDFYSTENGGGIREEGDYKEGSKDGLWTSWYVNGQKTLEVNFKEGKEDGLWTLWNEKGQKEVEGNWKDGKRSGTWTWWDWNGNITRNRTYEEGELVI